LVAGSATAAGGKRSGTHSHHSNHHSHHSSHHASRRAHAVAHKPHKVAAKHPVSKAAAAKPHPAKTPKSIKKPTGMKSPAKVTKPATGMSKPGEKYHLKYGTSFAGGICYQGRNHYHWTYSGYSSRYGCICYWCPSTCRYYYWYEPARCYYPVTYYKCAPAIETVKVATEITTPPAGVPPLPK
jgi:hypothetical protein